MMHLATENFTTRRNRLPNKPHLKIVFCLKSVEPQPFTSKSLSKDMEVDTFEVEIWVILDKLSIVYSCWLPSPSPK
jgi:hypothetical protein